jgi:hypothetical protein
MVKTLYKYTKAPLQNQNKNLTGIPALTIARILAFNQAPI